MTNKTILVDAPVPAIEKPSAAKIAVALLTGGQDRPYAFGLAKALADSGIALDVIGSDEVDSPEFHTSALIKFLNLRGNQRLNAGLVEKITRVMKYYARLLVYSATAQPKVFHVLWNNRFEWFDRTLLMGCYKLCGRRVTFTAHNINIRRRDGNDSLLNRLTLRLQYRMCDHIFVHTKKMKKELIDDFGVSDEAITVLTHPVNDAFPETALTVADAKSKLGLRMQDKTVLFFGRIGPYKGLEYLVEAFQRLAREDPDYRLIIAGERKRGAEDYTRTIRAKIRDEVAAGRILERIQFIPDDQVELYFKAADVLVLPYKEIFQSGVLFLGYTFGLPVVASDVGSFRDEIVEGETGFLCRPNDSTDLALSLAHYFSSDLYRNLIHKRQQIRLEAHRRHSWQAVAEVTRSAYARLIRRDLA